ncbi:MAG: hypothetical protein D8M57_19920 [Candidatus Scalindua sp. AMX11]|nr:hypothetical protein [Planctomycetota bacterium]RZV60699.1 MAG: hypothetical protein EX341_19190 [Candidatus Scalindua sp. SCAELEC01]TDE63129.1 MAG: hypothetical protein D8M57_19920 [Candidatus Scalindua sp. AMX11]GJQ60943.1 MAG: hypothetical protein SCALA701_37440 [Candidatus Scalindua sp.]NOG82998.1 hypothetical protein [Planctomycetota bacterium]
MTLKRPICPNRIRKVPGQFSWIDHRLVRDRYIEKCSHQAAALYLFLVTVSDAKGLSFYSDVSLMRRLVMDRATLQQARVNLIQVDLIAYVRPLYQVLDLGRRTPTLRKSPQGQPRSLGQILRQIREDEP